jgi:putative transposase
MLPCLHLTRLSSAVERSSWPVWASDRSLRWPSKLSISESCLRNWLAQADVDERGSDSRLTSAEKRELSALRRDKRRFGDGKRDPQAGGRVLRPGKCPPKLAFRLVRELAENTDADIDVAVACRVLGVSRSGYYDWLGRPPSARDDANSLLLKHIQEVHADSRGTYGWPRAHAELTLGLGLPVNHKRVARLMRQAGLQGLYRRRYRRGATGPVTEDDLVQRRFTVEAPNRLWLTDITEHPTREGKLYCAAVMDTYSRLIVGWSMPITCTPSSWSMRWTWPHFAGPEIASTILHSDHGTQYTSWAFGQRLRAAGLLPSMGTIGDCYDNSMMESF